MEYNFRDLEAKWQLRWREQQTYKTVTGGEKPKYYVLDMFPYPSGAGLHVGHPLGYIASDIVARYKRLKGFNVLHPMGYDAFGLPAEQYAIQTGQHPKITTEQNIARYREQLDKIGFSFDWDREVRTSDPEYYKWTQWIFVQLFHSWYDNKTQKAAPILKLIAEFEKSGNQNVDSACDATLPFSAEDWKSKNEQEQQQILLNYRLAYLSEAWVNWCAGLGTVLANDEVKDGVSERGGYPVERRRMPQWSLRITAYAERLLSDLETLDWTDSIKEAQRNWIGKSEGTSIRFKLKNQDEFIEVFTTRPDTIFGVSFVTLAPEHELVNLITTDAQKSKVEEYVSIAKNRSERERQTEVKRISGEFTGAYVVHPFTGKDIPVWIGDYVLAGYGTGAVMAVPAHDSRDFAFATHFDLPKPQVIEPPADATTAGFENESWDEKEGKLIHSDFLNGLDVKPAIRKAIDEIEKLNFGKGRINYRLRDAAFGRQRYWGEPIPIYYKDGMPYTLAEDELPLILPAIDKFQPTETGEPPLARAKDWKYKGEYEYEYTTMPGWAGSSWYFLRYMDAKNDKALVSPEAVAYWKNVDFYIGGAEHATGHLLYVRFWTKFLFDLGIIPLNEPAQKLINQGMIQGVSDKVYIQKVQSNSLPISKSESILLDDDQNVFYWSADVVDLGIHRNPEILKYQLLLQNTAEAFLENFYIKNVPIEDVKENKLDIITYSEKSQEKKIVFVCKGGYWYKNKFTPIDSDDNSINHDFLTFSEVEKMSKSKWNVVSPDDIILQYGADTLRLYEMFLGPLEQSKPWSTQGISGVHNFLRRFWRLFHDKENKLQLSEEGGSAAELKSLHKTIKKIEEDIDRFSFNTCISTFMICVNELTDLNCKKRSVLEPLVVLLAPFAPHFCEELWELLGHKESVSKASFPKWNEAYLVEDNFEYPVSVNGKVRFKMNLSLKLSKEEIEQTVMSSDELSKYLQGSPKKVIVVPGRIVNVVI